MHGVKVVVELNRKFFKSNLYNDVYFSFYFAELFLDDDDVEKLHDFEEECVDEYMRRKDENEEKQVG